MFSKSGDAFADVDRKEKEIFLKKGKYPVQSCLSKLKKKELLHSMGDKSTSSNS